MELRPNHRLLSPGFVIETHYGEHKNLSGIKVEKPERTLCHFEGEVVNHSDSSLALATCNGLVSGVPYLTQQTRDVGPMLV